MASPAWTTNTIVTNPELVVGDGPNHALTQVIAATMALLLSDEHCGRQSCAAGYESLC
jgi:hypothetical protein